MSKLVLKNEATTPAAPAAGFTIIYIDADGLVEIIRDGQTQPEAVLSLPSPTVVTDTESPYAVDESEGIIILDGTAGAVTANLPAGAGSLANHPIRFKCINSTSR